MIRNLPAARRVMKVMKNIVTALGLAIALTLSWCGVATAAPTQTQTFSGGSGFGTQFRSGNPAIAQSWSGFYETSSQLGVGEFRFDQSVAAPRFARFIRSIDGMTMNGTNRLTPLACGVMPPRTTCLTFELDGKADIVHAHLVIAQQINANRFAHFLMSGTLALAARSGYVIVDANGATYRAGGIDHLGDAPTSGVTDIELTPSRQGYWIVNRAGQVYAFGDARYLGNANRSAFAGGEFVSGIVSTPTGKGYWLFSSRGRVIAFGDAPFLGDLHAKVINGRIVAAVATPTGKGYYLAAGDGGVFAFGDARFRGSMGGIRLNRPVVAIVLSPDASGYWLFGADGGVFSFHAPFLGAFAATALFHQSITAAGPGLAAYRQATNDGEVFQWTPDAVLNFEGRRNLATPIVGIASTR